MASATDPTDTLVAWVNGVTTIDSPERFVDDLCNRILELGAPIDRAAIFLHTLHPNLMGRRFLWRRGERVEVDDAPIALLDDEIFMANPIRDVMVEGVEIRRKIEDPDCPMDYRILGEFREEGVTDYLIQPLPFTNGELNAVSWTTRAPGGFAAEHLRMLEGIRLPLTRVSEIYTLRRAAVTLLNTYVGREPGARIWQGQIRRGDTERIRAVIWLSDLRGFTQIADKLPGEALVSHLNDFFDCLVPPIEAHGGQVLKFMGDGLLAIFPLVEGTSSEAEVCTAALSAALDARKAIAAYNAGPEVSEDLRLRFGLALHIGEVLFGNIGGASRLDFTTIGPGVNLAARLEKLSGELGRDVILSADFAAHAELPLDRLGRFELRGFADEEEAFGLP